ncbi:MAG: SDR family NAD(P)-dependent oxidoreductase [Sphingomonadales bacterium]|nr:SDR family NAD(P)-dependent oxidoreductase [Sphingomonadales bacterium]
MPRHSGRVGKSARRSQYTGEQVAGGSRWTTVLITGASSGLGVHFARLFASRGANVIVGARRIERWKIGSRLAFRRPRRARRLRWMQRMKHPSAVHLTLARRGLA